MKYKYKKFMVKITNYIGVLMLFVQIVLVIDISKEEVFFIITNLYAIPTTLLLFIIIPNLYLIYIYKRLENE